MDTVAGGVKMVELGFDVGANVGVGGGVNGEVVLARDAGSVLCETQRFCL